MNKFKSVVLLSFLYVGSQAGFSSGSPFSPLNREVPPIQGKTITVKIKELKAASRPLMKISIDAYNEFNKELAKLDKQATISLTQSNPAALDNVNAKFTMLQTQLDKILQGNNIAAGQNLLNQASQQLIVNSQIIPQQQQQESQLLASWMKENDELKQQIIELQKDHEKQILTKAQEHSNSIHNKTLQYSEFKKIFSQQVEDIGAQLSNVVNLEKDGSENFEQFSERISSLPNIKMPYEVLEKFNKDHDAEKLFRLMIDTFNPIQLKNKVLKTELARTCADNQKNLAENKKLEIELDQMRTESQKNLAENKELKIELDQMRTNNKKILEDSLSQIGTMRADNQKILANSLIQLSTPDVTDVAVQVMDVEKANINTQTALAAVDHDLQLSKNPTVDLDDGPTSLQLSSQSENYQAEPVQKQKGMFSRALQMGKSALFGSK